MCTSTSAVSNTSSTLPGRSKFPNNTVMEKAGILSMFTLLNQRCLRWLGHLVRMDDGQIPKDPLYRASLGKGLHRQTTFVLQEILGSDI